MADFKKIEKRRNNEWMVRLDIDLKETADRIIDERRRKGLDKKDLPYRELFNASFRFEPLIDILKKAEIKRKNETQKY